VRIFLENSKIRLSVEGSAPEPPSSPAVGGSTPRPPRCYSTYYYNSV